MILDRITLDLDYYEPQFRLKALRAYHGLAALDAVEDIVIHISTSGRGLHIEGHLSEMLEDDQRHRVRHNLSDDSMRTYLDEVRTAVGHAGDIYWDEKAGNDGERERMDGIYAALDRLESTRAPDHSRVKAVALHGRKGVYDNHGLNRASLAEGL